MVELTSYGLTALTAVLVIVFCFTYGQQSAAASPRGKTSPLETVRGATHNDGFQSDRGSGKASNG